MGVATSLPLKGSLWLKNHASYRGREIPVRVRVSFRVSVRVRVRVRVSVTVTVRVRASVLST